MNSGTKIEIEDFEEHDQVTYYTVRFLEEEYSETEKFFDTEYDYENFEEDISVISKVIDKIGERGSLERYFRNAGSIKDNVSALPEYLYTNTELRLYAIRLSDSIVILGNGGRKTTKTYNEDSNLLKHVEILQQVDGFIKARIKSGQLNIYNKKLYGKLTFYLNEKTK